MRRRRWRRAAAPSSDSQRIQASGVHIRRPSWMRPARSAQPACRPGM